MVVTCPQCAKRYMLDEMLLPQEGRQVRCVTCHHVWKQVPNEGFQPPIPAFIGNADIGLQMNVSSEKPKTSWMGWIAFAAIFTIGFSTLILGRNYIVTHWPPAEKYYELLGLQINIPGVGLAITNASSQIRQEGSIDMIRIMGSVVNTSKRAQTIPPLHIKLMGDSSHPKCLEKGNGEGCVLGSWEHRLSEQSLLPGEKIQFETYPRPKIEGTKHIQVEF